MSLQPLTDDLCAGEIARLAELTAEPFGGDHPHAEAWALYVASEACLAAGAPELAVIAISDALGDGDCERCHEAFLALGLRALLALGEQA